MTPTPAGKSSSRGGTRTPDMVINSHCGGSAGQAVTTSPPAVNAHECARIRTAPLKSPLKSGTANKRCTRCGALKSVRAFTARPDSRDGLRSHCKACVAGYVRRWAATGGRAVWRRNSQEMAARFPERARARRLLRLAVKSGKIAKSPCAGGGTPCRGRLEAHHPDYARPLDVVWMCQRHHRLVAHEGSLRGAARRA